MVLWQVDQVIGKFQAHLLCDGDQCTMNLRLALFLPPSMSGS